MYNLDAQGYPIPGAPIPIYLDNDLPAVCSLCYEMYKAVERAPASYWHTDKPSPAKRNTGEVYERHS